MNEWNTDLIGTTEHSVAGGWLGTYYYDRKAATEPARFEATFSAMARTGRFDGKILDDSALGEARALEGQQSGDSVSFAKVYIKPPRGHAVAPVQYEGTLSEDGKRITGTWRLEYNHPTKRRAVRMNGTWEARRLWYDLQEEISEATPERELMLIGERR